MDTAQLLIALGALFLAGLAADQAGRLARLPRVTMLLLLGLAAGDTGFGILPEEVAGWFEILSIVALTMVAFLLGSSLSRENLARHGRAILAISLAVAVATILIVAAGLAVAGLTTGLALILAAVATATDPASVADVIRQSGRSNGYTKTLEGIVAIDDAWGLIAFSIILVLAGQSDGWAGLMAGAVHDIGGAMLLGGAVGLPAAYLTGRLSPGEPLQAEAIGLVFLTAGFAIWLDVSYLVAGMTAGAVIVNLARHHDRAFHEIEHVQWPFMILFFLLAGASLDPDALRRVGWIGGFYLVLRVIARLIGGWAGALLGRVPAGERPWYGPALLPQAGVAVGMALVAGESFPHWRAEIMALTIAVTVAFEIVGPPVTLFAIRKAPGKD